MAQDSQHVRKSINLKPNASPDLTQTGDLGADSSDSNRLKYNRGTGAQRVLLTEDAAAPSFTTSGNVDYDNTVSGLTATNVKAAIDELDTNVGTAQSTANTAVSNAATAQSTADNHINDTTAAHAASAIGNTPAGGIAATDVQAAINELDTEKANLASPTFTGTPAAPTAALHTNTTQVATTAFVKAEVDDHINDTTSAHAASSIAVTPVGGVAATDVQAAIQELDSEKATTGYADGKVSDVAYDATSWNGVTDTAPSKNAVRDIIEQLQPLDADLTAIAGLTATTDNFIQAKSSAWASRTPTQVTADLIAMIGDSGSGGTKGLVPAPAAGDAAANKYLKADGTWNTVAATGGGATNFITNYTAETNTTGWATYADAAGTSPVDGTGGSPTVTWTRSTSSPMIGTASFLFTKDAANRQGQGASYDFTIDAAYKAKVLQIGFEYQVDSGTFVAGSSSTDSDVTVWLYDVTNAVLIQPSTYKLYSNSALATTFSGCFQTASNSTSYRLIFHCTSTSASAYTLKIDNVSVSPTQYVYGTPISDWTSYTPTFTGLGTPTSVEFQSRRVGSNREIRGKYATGTTTGVEARISLPTGDTSADTTKIPSIQNIGTMTANATMAGSFSVLIEPSVTYLTLGKQSATETGLTKRLGSDFPNTTLFSLFASIPIQGWGASTQMSDQADTRLVTFSGVKASTQAVTANVTDVTFTSSKDSHGAWSGSAYTVPVAGDYLVTLNLGNTGASLINIYVFVNGASVKKIIKTLGSGPTTSGTAYLANLSAGAVVSIRSESTDTINGGAVGGNTEGSLSITRQSGPSSISATETIAASYWVSSNFVASTSTPINFDSKEYDTHGAVTPSATVWKFTAPASGIYEVSINLFVSASSQGYILHKNGTAYKSAGYASNTYVGNDGLTIPIKLLAGEYIDIRPDASTPTTLGGSLAAVNTSNIAIKRIGIF